MSEFRFETAGGTGGNGSGEEELRELYDWLRADRALRGETRFTPVREAEPGRMGPGLEAVLAIVNTAMAFPPLLLSVDAWRQSRRARPPQLLVIGSDTDQVTALRRALGLPAEPEEARTEPTGAEPTDEAGPDQEPTDEPGPDQEPTDEPGPDQEPGEEAGPAPVAPSRERP
ncbi:hypothetical protein [Streptomyces sp. SID11385]|uniref:effector-associated constant component EACC1 n=1 Tax=Streptomyces sp. SID11385 TaxID=2706031 RepID=UPI001940BC73